MLYSIKDLWYSIKRFFRPCHPRWRKVYPRHKFIDLRESIVKVNFAIILDFWYEEVKRDIVDWEATPQHKEFYCWLESAIVYIETTRPELVSAINVAFASSSPGTRIEDSGEIVFLDGEPVLDLTPFHLEANLDELDNKVLTELMSYRTFFWT